MSARPVRVAGSLHNLVLEIAPAEIDEANNAGPSRRSMFHILSTHAVELAPGPRAALGRDVISAAPGAVVPLSPSKRLRTATSLTPSPQKSQQWRAGPRLAHWRLRLCQQVREDVANGNAEGEGKNVGEKSKPGKIDDSSETESDEERQVPMVPRAAAKGKAKETSEHATRPHTTTSRKSAFQSASPEVMRRDREWPLVRSAWYSVVFDAAEADEAFVKPLQNASRKSERSATPAITWTEVEQRIKHAWEEGRVDVAVPRQRQHAHSSDADGTYERVQVIFGASSHVKSESSNENSKAGDSADSGPSAPIVVTLHRLPPSIELNEATSASVELMQALGVLTTKTQQLTAERNQRRFLYEGGRKKMVKEASASTTNVGRIRRKLVDDEGFEGDDDE